MLRGLAACVCADGFLPKGSRKKHDDDDDEGKGITHDDIWCLDLKTHTASGLASPAPRGC